jgi:hypothetical protein
MPGADHMTPSSMDCRSIDASTDSESRKREGGGEEETVTAGVERWWWSHDDVGGGGGALYRVRVSRGYSREVSSYKGGGRGGGGEQTVDGALKDDTDGGAG